MPYTQSNQFLRNYKKYQGNKYNKAQNTQDKLLEHVLKDAPKNNPSAILDSINAFCRNYWMMNVGEDKGEIVKKALKKFKPKSILQLGGYCGFSALLMAANSNATVHTIEVNDKVANIAHRIHQHAGLASRIIIHIGNIQFHQSFIENHGKFDFIFIDHVKHLYLKDLRELENFKAIRSGTVVVGDNIIWPGAPDYLKYFQESNLYDSILYHSHLQYSDEHDAVLVSERIKD